MRLLLKLEELALFALALYLYSQLNYSWITFMILIFTPDLSMVGYLINAKVGALAYNLVHHKATAILLYLIGVTQEIKTISLIGIILFAHSSLDRVLGYGLKYPDSFQNTHLGKIGKR
jgi:hypothetical protein